jgi:hypothetical protein
MSISVGENIYNATLLIDKAGEEINSFLYDITQNKVTKAIENNDDLRFLDSDEDCRYSNSGWLCSDGLIWFSIKTTGKGNRPIRYFTIQVSLYGDGVSSGKVINKEPLIHIALFGETPRFKSSDFYYCSMEDLDDAEPEFIQDEILWNWYPEAEKLHEQMWIYSIRLTAINSVEDIENKIINPFFNNLSDTNSMLEELKPLSGIALYQRQESANAPDKFSYEIKFIE